MKSNLFLFLIFVLSLNGCGKNDTSEISGIEIVLKDDVGREVVLDKKPERIISIGPSITENLFEIGADEKLIGVTNYCNYPPEANRKLRIGDINPDYELITTLEPDLIFIVSSTPSSPVLTKFESLGLKVFVADPKEIEDIFGQMLLLGELTGRRIEAAEKVNTLKLRKSQIETKASNENRSCLIILSLSPLVTVNANTFLHKAVSLTGLKNLFANETVDYPTVNYEDAISKNPEVIILPFKENNERLNESIATVKEKFSTTDAVKNNRIIIVDPDILLRSTSRLLDGAGQIQEKIEHLK